MVLHANNITAFLVEDTDVVLVRVEAVQGSTPRETDAFMLVSQDRMCGTIGGGQLEFIAIDTARQMLRNGQTNRALDIPLGPDIGQCCGGRVQLSLDFVSNKIADDLKTEAAASEAVRPSIFVFGAGHVGRALAIALSPLPFRTHLIDTRSDVFADLPSGISTRVSALPEADVRAAPAGSNFVVLTHDHALDFLITREALLREDARFVGLIGSKTKRAQFRRWFLGEGGYADLLQQLTCPIGAAGLGDKTPEIIASLVCAEIIVKNRPTLCAEKKEYAKLALRGGGS